MYRGEPGDVDVALAMGYARQRSGQAVRLMVPVHQS
jgi:hypothetical protein